MGGRGLIGPAVTEIVHVHPMGWATLPPPPDPNESLIRPVSGWLRDPEFADVVNYFCDDSTYQTYQTYQTCFGLVLRDPDFLTLDRYVNKSAPIPELLKNGGSRFARIWGGGRHPGSPTRGRHHNNFCDGSTYQTYQTYQTCFGLVVRSRFPNVRSLR